MTEIIFALIGVSNIIRNEYLWSKGKIGRHYDRSRLLAATKKHYEEMFNLIIRVDDNLIKKDGEL